jgi:hypothetical protein
MSGRLSNESEHGSQESTQDAALFAWQPRDNFAPATEFSLEGSGALQKSIETFNESPRAAFGLQRVANCHLFKGEEKICARLNSAGLDEELALSHAHQRHLRCSGSRGGMAQKRPTYGVPFPSAKSLTESVGRNTNEPVRSREHAPDAKVICWVENRICTWPSHCRHCNSVVENSYRSTRSLRWSIQITSPMA